MGADDKTKKKTAKKASTKKPSPNDIQEVTFTEEQEQLFGEAMATTADLVDDMKAVGIPIREFALAMTKLEEAEMWFQRGFEALGIDDLDDEEEADDESAEDEEEE